MILPTPKESTKGNQIDTDDIEMRLREEINKKMEICMQLISEQNSGNADGLVDKIDTVVFNLNQLEHQCKRGQLALEQEVDRLDSLVNSKEGLAQKQDKSRQKDGTSPSNISRKGSKSEKSLSKGKAKTVASRIRDE